MENDWFYVSGSSERGPFSQEHLRELLSAGEIGPDTMVRKWTWLDWQKASAVDLLARAPIPPDAGHAEQDRAGRTNSAIAPGALWLLRRRPLVICSIFASVLFAFVAVVAVGVRTRGNIPSAKESDRPTAPTTEVSDQELLDWAKSQHIPEPNRLEALDPVNLYAKSRAAVATVLTKDDLGFDAGLGSGFFIAPYLIATRYKSYEFEKIATNDSRTRGGPQYAYLLTNYHVIRSAATAEVRLGDGRVGSVRDVVLEQEDADLAVVSVCFLDHDEPSKPTKLVEILPIAAGSEPSVGERVYAIGSPQGLDASLSEGIISGRRQIVDGIWWLQTSAPVSPGSSGGPLLKSTGEAVGVITAQRRIGQNLNFAVPASQVYVLLDGRYNSRELWRGTGIGCEEEHAYDDAAAGDERRMETKCGRLLEEAYQQLYFDDDFNKALDLLAAVAPPQCGKHEFLLHFTLGYATAVRAEANLRAAGTENETMREYYERVRNNDDQQTAKRLFRSAIRLKPTFSPAYRRLAWCLFHEGQFGEAIMIANQLVKLVPRCATAYKLKGQLYSRTNRPSEAFADLKTAADLGPNDPETYFEIGGVCIDETQAVEAYETAIRLKSPVAHMCYFNIGSAYKRMGKYEQALASFEEAKALGAPASFCAREIADCQRRLR